MNKRIIELADEAAKFSAMLALPTGESGDKLFVEKFAELIVQECLDVVAMRLYLGPEEICRQECKALAAEIKEHFGVEE